MDKKFDLNNLNKYLFYLVLILNIFLLFATRFYPSMDGPAHLYNAKILNGLIAGNPLFKEVYSINSLLVPNWTATVLLSAFTALFPAWFAEKLLIILYISGMAFSFRYMIKQINPGNIALSLLIFPFIYSFLFHLGFYNFSLSFIFYFLSIGYFYRIHISGTVSNYFILFLLLLLTYYSNIIIFGFLGISLGLFILYFTYEIYEVNRNIKDAMRYGGKQLLILLLLSLPGLVFMIIFISQVNFFPSDVTVSPRELIKWINDARPFIVYDYIKEETYTTQFFHALLALFIISLFKFNSSGNIFSSFKFKATDVLFIPVLLSGILLFLTPDGAGAGMMSYRYSLMLFLFGISWICARTVTGNVTSLVIMAVLFLHLGLQRKHLRDALAILDKDAKNINKAEEFIAENSVVLPVNLTDHWLEPHFSDYLGVGKPVLILENYEASVGWFPVKYKKDLPAILLADRTSVPGVTWKSGPDTANRKAIDYIFIYGNAAKMHDEKWQELNEIIASHFKMKYNSEDRYVLLYERIP